ncbi:MAG: FG-GAP repeat protein [Planctomycetota bacterium]
MRTTHHLVAAGTVLSALFLGHAAAAQAMQPDATLVAGDPNGSDRFGYAVAAFGDLAVVGATNDDEAASEAGAAYVWSRGADGGWTFVTKLIAADAAPGDLFGTSVAAFGDRIVVGAYLKNSARGTATGAAYVFERQPDGTWMQQAQLLANDGAAGDRLGISVGVFGDRVLVGASHADPVGSSPGTNTGAAYVFDRQVDGRWTQTARLSPAGEPTGALFGWSVSLWGDRALVGAYQEAGAVATSGAAHVFDRDPAGTWSESARFAPADGAAGDSFGITVALEGDEALVGAPGDDDAGAGSGTVRVFRRDSGGSWNELPRLLPPEVRTGDAFGSAVALSAGHALLGAFADDDDGDLSGSAYLYERRTDGTWWRSALLHADGGSAGDRFGYAAALWGDTALVGAFASDAAAPNAGAVGAFRIGALLHGQPRVSIASGGSQPMLVRRGETFAGSLFLVVGSITGTTPGIPLAPGVLVPLNFDAYTQLTLEPGSPVVAPSLLLDADGAGSAAFQLPAGTGPEFAGLVLHHAVVGIHPTLGFFTSDPIALELVN